MTYLTVLINKDSLSNLEIMGLLFGLVGATVISTGDLAISKLKEIKTRNNRNV